MSLDKNDQVHCQINSQPPRAWYSMGGAAVAFHLISRQLAASLARPGSCWPSNARLVQSKGTDLARQH
eukprot:1610329-Rhodomonas_salina.1